MANRSITICGLPESGKTTYLAALWHLVTAYTDGTQLRFASLKDGDFEHLNTLAQRWRNGLSQKRTDSASSALVSMNLLDQSGSPLRLTFPDVSGESYRAMFEERDCSTSIAKILREGESIAFFIHADRIRKPRRIVDIVSQSTTIGTSSAAEQDIPWSPSLAPTQVKVVDLLQLLRLPPLELNTRRIAIVLSVWDKASDEGLSPDQYLGEHLPLLSQYLGSGADGWEYRVYGVSAQGGDYEKENEPLSGSQGQRLQELKALDDASMRIRVVSGSLDSHDITEPISWLMG
jgi:hypothetical protein